MTSEIDDETLMAYVDGELDAAAAAKVERATAADPAVASRVAVFRRTREAVARDARRQPAPPVTAALLARVGELAAARSAAGNGHAARPGATKVPPGHGRRLALAAAVSLAVGLAAGLLAGRDRGSAPGLRIAAPADRALDATLATVPSGERATLPEGGEIVPVATFRGGEDELCREFEYRRTSTTTLGIACREADGWRVRFAVVAASVPEDGYSPASSVEALDAYLNATGARAPLSIDDEAAALGGLQGDGSAVEVPRPQHDS